MLNFKLIKPYFSIRSLDACPLPSFAVLTGRNGAGKTQFMQAIIAGNIVVDSIDKSQVTYLDNFNFRVRTHNSGPGRQILDEAYKSFDRHVVRDSEGGVTFFPDAKTNFDRMLEYHREQSDDKDKFLQDVVDDDFHLWNDDINNKCSTAKNFIEEYRAYIEQNVFGGHHRNIDQASKNAIRNTGRYVHLITERDFVNQYIPIINGNNFLQLSIGNYILE